MQEHIFLENYRNDEVFSFHNTIFKVGRLREIMRSSVVPQLESAVQELCKTQQLQINTSKYNPQTRNSWQQQWFGDGIECETLKIGGKGWQKGKVKIKVILEFCPDEPEVEEMPENNNLETSQPESPLDDLRRQLLNQENSPS